MKRIFKRFLFVLIFATVTVLAGIVASAATPAASCTITGVTKSASAIVIEADIANSAQATQASLVAGVYDGTGRLVGATVNTLTLPAGATSQVVTVPLYTQADPQKVKVFLLDSGAGRQPIAEIAEAPVTMILPNSAEVTPDGNIQLSFGVKMADPAGATSEFTVKIAGFYGTVPVTEISCGSEDTKLLLILGKGGKVKNGAEVVTVGYSKGNVPVKTSAGNELSDFASFPVTNSLDLPQPLPNGLAAASPATYGGDDGLITGVTAGMEYILASAWHGDDTVYTPVTGSSITGLSPGWYYIRYSAKPGYVAGDVATIEVPKGFVCIISSSPIFSIDDGKPTFTYIITPDNRGVLELGTSSDGTVNRFQEGDVLYCRDVSGTTAVSLLTPTAAGQTVASSDTSSMTIGSTSIPFSSDCSMYYASTYGYSTGPSVEPGDIVTYYSDIYGKAFEIIITSRGS